MTISDDRLLEYLACPEDKGPLWYFDAEDLLYNPRLQRAYPIVDGIPVMIIDDARSVPTAEHDQLMATAESRGITGNFVVDGES